MVGETVHVHSGYNAWGSVNHQYPTPTNGDSFLKFGYNARWGYVTDASTGLSYCQNRYYDPQTGRFLTRDPIGYAGGSNLYGYCGGNPVGAADPSGLWDVTAFGVDYQFTWDSVGSGFKLSGAALLSMLSELPEGSMKISPLAMAIEGALGHDILPSWDGGSFADEEGFQESKVCWAIASVALSGAETAGAKIGAKLTKILGRMFGRKVAPGPVGLSFTHPQGASRAQIRKLGRDLIKNDPDAVAKYGQPALDSVKSGLNPKAIHPNGQEYPMHWSHEPIPFSQGGTRVVLRKPWEHGDFHFRP